MALMPRDVTGTQKSKGVLIFLGFLRRTTSPLSWDRSFGGGQRVLFSGPSSAGRKWVVLMWEGRVCVEFCQFLLFRS